MNETDSGHIIGGPVDTEYDGSVLTADLAVTGLVLYVQDIADFDEKAAIHGGQVILGADLGDDGLVDMATATVLDYTTCDDDTGTVTLAAGSPVTASAGDIVYIASPTGSPVGQFEVMVAMDDGDTTGDALTAILDVALLESAGEVDLTDLAVDLAEDPDTGQLVVRGFPGLTQRQGQVKGWALDTHTVTALGDQIMYLTYRPIPQTEHLRWDGDSLPYSDFTRDGWVVTIPDPDGALEVGDVLTMQYLYTDPTPRPVIPGSALLVGVTELPTNSATEVALPPGTLPGHLLVLSIHQGGFGIVPSCSDPRIDHQHVMAQDLVGWGLATASTDPIAIESSDGENNGGIILAAYEIVGGIEEVYSESTTGPFAPTMPVAADAAVLVASYGASFRPNPPDPPFDEWSLDANRHGGGGATGRAEAWSTPAPPTPASFAIDGGYLVYVLGLIPS